MYCLMPSHPLCCIELDAKCDQQVTDVGDNTATSTVTKCYQQTDVCRLFITFGDGERAEAKFSKYRVWDRENYHYFGG